MEESYINYFFVKFKNFIKMFSKGDKKDYTSFFANF